MPAPKEAGKVKESQNYGCRCGQQCPFSTGRGQEDLDEKMDFLQYKMSTVFVRNMFFMRICQFAVVLCL